MRSSARPPSKRRAKISPKWRLTWSKASWNRSWAVRVMPRRARSRSLMEPVRSSYCARRKPRRSSSSRYSSSATRLTAPMASSFWASSAWRARRSRGGRARGRGRRPARSLPSTPWLRRASCIISSRRTRPSVSCSSRSWMRPTRRCRSALGRAQLGLDGLALGQLGLVDLGGGPHLALEPVAVDHGVARARVRPSRLAGELGAALGELGAAPSVAPSSRSSASRPSASSRSMSRAKPSTRSATAATSTRPVADLGGEGRVRPLGGFHLDPQAPSASSMAPSRSRASARAALTSAMRRAVSACSRSISGRSASRVARYRSSRSVSCRPPRGPCRRRAAPPRGSARRSRATASRPRSAVSAASSASSAAALALDVGARAAISSRSCRMARLRRRIEWSCASRSPSRRPPVRRPVGWSTSPAGVT